MSSIGASEWGRNLGDVDYFTVPKLSKWGRQDKRKMTQLHICRKSLISRTAPMKVCLKIKEHLQKQSRLLSRWLSKSSPSTRSAGRVASRALSACRRHVRTRATAKSPVLATAREPYSTLMKTPGQCHFWFQMFIPYLFLRSAVSPVRLYRRSINSMGVRQC